MPSTDVAHGDPSTRSVTTSPALYRALTLEERARAVTASPRPAEDYEHGATRLRRWKTQHPLLSGHLFANRLEAAALDESQLLRLLGEREDHLQARHPDTPRWLARLAAACAAETANEPLLLHDSVKSRPEHGFLVAASPLVRDAQARLSDGVAEIARRSEWDALKPASVSALLGEEMLHAVLGQLSRTLVLELHVARLEGRLHGDSSEKRFHSFIDRLRVPAARATLFEEYPVLGRLIATTLDRHVDARLEFLERLVADRVELRVHLGGPDANDELMEVSTIGDPHRGGRGVILARFSSGFDLVYKPKPLAVDRHFQELLRWLNECGWSAPFRLCRLLDRGDYGWMEFVHTEPCRCESELARFYHRMGGHLALLHTLGATDLHFENLVAAAEQPMLIDLETLFHPALLGSSPDAGTARVNREIAESVLSVGLLPERTTLGAPGADLDLSGLGARGDQLSPDATPCWAASGTDTMRLERRQMLLPLGEHSPTLNDANNRVDFSAYVDNLIDGFEAMYHLLLDQRDLLLQPRGPLHAFRDDSTRVVLRPTHSYYMLIRESGHPDLLRDALDRDRHFDRLWSSIDSHPELERVVAHEHRDLWYGDIPLFTTRPSSRDVWTSTGERIPGYLNESGWELLERRLQRMGEPDLERQLWLVRAALATAMPALANTGSRPRRLLMPRPLSGESIVDVATAIGDRVVALALTNKGHASWLSDRPTGNGSSAIRPMGPDLYSGLSGVALFLAWLATLSGERHYDACAREALQSIRAQVRSNAGTAGVGGFAGWGSVVYTFSHLATLLDEPALADDAEALAERLAASIDTDEHLDVLGGAAGFLLALLSLHRATGCARALELARRCGERLIARAQPTGPGVGWTIPDTAGRPLAGLSHGAAGIALSLLKLAELTRARSYRETAAAALRYERTLFDSRARSWQDLRSDREATTTFVNAWCHGAPGIGLARLAGLTSLDDPDVRFEIETAVETTLREGFEMNHSLCHGVLGNLELPMAAALAFRRTDWQSAVDSAISRILRGLTSAGPICGSLAGIETPGLMTGLAGIGYGLLRLGFPDRVPSVLTLEAPRVAR